MTEISPIAPLSPYMFKISTFCHSTLPTTTSNVDKSRNVRLPFWAHKIRCTLDFSIPISQEHCLNDFSGDRAKTLISASALPLSVELIFRKHRLFNSSWTVPSTSNLYRILVIVTLVGGGVPIQPSNVVELQQHSPLSNNVSVSTYVHRMIISLPCLFKHMKKMNMLQCFSSAFWIIHNKNVFLYHFVAEK